MQHERTSFVRTSVQWSVLLMITLAGACATGYSKHAVYKAEPQSALANHNWEDIVTKQSSGEMEFRSESIASSPVRHRRLIAYSPVANLAGVVGGLFAGQQAPPTAAPLGVPIAQDPEKLVVEAWIDMKVDDPAKVAALIRARVEADGGRVISENVIGPTSAASSAALELRVPPLKAAGLQVWLATQGLVESRRVLATDVGKQLFDQELALKNLDVTMTRLQKIAEKDAPMKELIEIETEMTRVRGQIEKLKGENRWLLDRVAFATITLTLSREGGPVEFAPHVRIHPGPHLSTLTLLDPIGRPRTRVGGGGTIHIQRWLTFDLDLFPAKGTDTRAVIGTIGGALYSSFLGGGHRAYGNPYLGFRVGMGYLSNEKAGVIGTELGVELYKQKYIQIGVALRAIAFLRDTRTDAALQAQLGFEIPF